MPVFRRHTEVLAEAVTFAGRRVLEVGCGDGRLLGWLAGKAALAVGLDPDSAQLARATASAGAGLLVRATGERLPFATAAFDLALLFNSLHHVPADRQSTALAEAARVLRPGGRLLVLAPNYAAARSVLAKAIGLGSGNRGAATAAKMDLGEQGGGTPTPPVAPPKPRGRR